LLAAQNLAQDTLDNAEARFESRSAVLQSEILLFTNLAEFYKEHVYAVATIADKDRV